MIGSHETLDMILDIVEHAPDQAGFQVLPRRWVVSNAPLLGWDVIDASARITNVVPRAVKALCISLPFTHAEADAAAA